jgi:hypothetical protein
MKVYGAVGAQIHSFFTSALTGGGWTALRIDRFGAGESAPSTHWIGSWVGPRTGLNDVERRKFLTLPELKLRLFGHPACSQSLCRLRYKNIVKFGYSVFKTGRVHAKKASGHTEGKRWSKAILIKTCVQYPQYAAIFHRHNLLILYNNTNIRKHDCRMYYVPFN